MAYSMTGFGHFEYVEGAEKVTCEIKSVNHRYLDLSLKIPKKLAAFEGEVRGILKERLSRGKVDCYLSYEAGAKEAVDVIYNEEIAAKYMDSLSQAAEHFGLKNDVTASTLAALPEVFEIKEAQADAGHLHDMVEHALSGALSLFLESRQSEGKRLTADLMDKLEEMRQLVAEVKRRSPEIIEEYRSRLSEKIRLLIEEGAVDETRIAMEVVIYADKVCVDEEIVRLESHLVEAEHTLSENDAIGRKLDFLAQELNREANTILSKSTDVEVANIGISLKTLVEKVREQIQNLE